MRMVVVLPLPLAPRKPQISPRATCRLKPSTTFSVAKALAQIVDVDDEIGHGGAARRPHRHRLAGIEQRRLVRRRPRLDQEDELGAGRFAVDDRRRVFGLRRDERDRAVRSGGQLSQDSATVSPAMDVGQRGSGTKKRTKMFSGGSSETTGAPAGSVSPGPRQHVGDDSGDGRRRPSAGRAATAPAPAPRRQPRPPRPARRSRPAGRAAPAPVSAPLRRRRPSPRPKRRSARCWSTTCLVAEPLASSVSLRWRSACTLPRAALASLQIGLRLGDLGRLGGRPADWRAAPWPAAVVRRA